MFGYSLVRMFLVSVRTMHSLSAYVLFFKILFISAEYFFNFHFQPKVAFKIIKTNGNFLSNLYFLLVVVHTMHCPLDSSTEIILRDIKTRVSGIHNTRVWESNLASNKTPTQAFVWVTIGFCLKTCHN